MIKIFCRLPSSSTLDDYSDFRKTRRIHDDPGVDDDDLFVILVESNH